MFSTKACDDVGKASIETVPGKDYILLPLWHVDLLFSQYSKSSPDAGFKPSGNDEKKVIEEPRKEGGDLSKDSECSDQEKEDYVNSTNTINAASTNEVNAVGAKTSIELCTKWVYKNKKDERGIVIKNKERLVAQGYTQEEGIDYDEVFAHVSKIKAIRLFLAYASFKDFVVYQMDVKSDFLYGELTFFLGLQVKQKNDGIFISQDKYVTEILKKFGFTDVKTASIPTETQKPLLKNKDGKEVDVHLYRSMIGSVGSLDHSMYEAQDQ
ncbi:retrovirus-related pol polyprotein from transposon TNT 1-94 [Tanacetum coccineum]